MAIALEILGDDQSLVPLTKPEFEKLVEEVVTARESELATPQAVTHGPVSGAHPLRNSLTQLPIPIQWI